MRVLILFSWLNLLTFCASSQSLNGPQKIAPPDTIYNGNFYWDLNCKLNSVSQPTIDSIAGIIRMRGYDSCLIITTAYKSITESESCAAFKSEEVKNALVMAKIDGSRIAIEGVTIASNTQQATRTLILAYPVTQLKQWLGPKVKHYEELYIEYGFNSTVIDSYFLGRVNFFFDSLSRDTGVKNYRVTSQACINEKRDDSLISAKRIMSLLNYLEAKYHIDRKKFILAQAEPARDCGVFPYVLLYVVRRK